MDAKKEFTESIVNNLKEKITEFKNRKKQEKSERKDELDFEINKELIDKFRKNHSGNSNIDINERINEEKKNLGILINPNPNEDKNIQISKLNNFDNIIQQNKKSQSNNNLNLQSILENKGNLQNLINNFSNQPEKEIKNNENDLNYIHKSKTNYSMLNNNLNQNNENNEREKQINIKKEEIMKDLLKNNNIEKKRKLSIGEKNSIRSNSFSLENYFSNEGSKDKLKNLQKQLESNNFNNNNNNKKLNNNYNGIPKYNYKNNNKVNDKIKYDFSSKFYNKNTNNLYKNNTNEIDNFADFTLKKGIKDNKEPFRTRTFSSNKVNNNINFNFDFTSSKSNLNIYNSKNSNSNLILNENEIRSLSSKIRFLSKEDIKNMNKTLIDELLSLSNSIKRTFQDYNIQNNNKIF